MTEAPFFTPPKLKPLGIDVVALDGGGYAPAQFFGKMADGRGVYCRYRGGGLTVRIAANPGEEAGSNDEILLDAVIGPPLHGGLSIGQLCRYAGITINGVVPPLPTATEIDEESLLDLSGETTFLNLDVISSRASAIGFYDAIVSEDLGVMGCDPVYGNWRNFKICKQGEFATGRRMCLVRRFGPDNTDRNWPDETANIRDVGSFPIFGLVQHAAFRADYKPMLLTYPQRPNKQAVFLQEKGGFEADNLWLRLSFPTDDKKGRELSAEIHCIFARKFPSTTVIAYNIETGARVPGKDRGRLYALDPEIAAWVAAGENRWLWGYKFGESFLGFRPGK